MCVLRSLFTAFADIGCFSLLALSFTPDQELHAHLNGSLSNETMRTLMQKKASKDLSSQETLQQWRTVIEKGETRQLDE